MYRLIFLLALLFTPTPRLIVLGDSVAHGAGASTPSLSWARLVANAYSLPLENDAVDSSKVAEQPLPQTRPGDTVIWLVGYNDMRYGTPLMQFRSTVATGVATLRSSGARVLLVSGLRMTPAGYAVNPQYNHGSDEQAKRYADSIRDLAPFVDLGGFVSSFAPDLVHPDDTGHAQIAQAILTPQITATWQTHTVLRVVWTAPAWHCVTLNGHWLERGCGRDAATFVLPSGGVDDAYKPAPGKILKLFDEAGRATASMVVPARVYRVNLGWVRG